MTSRLVSASAALWTVGFGVGYVVLIRGQDSPVAWWYLVVLAGAVVALAAHAAGRPRSFAVVAVVILALAALVAILSIGVFLLPAVAAAVVAVVLRPAVSQPPAAPERAVQP